MMITWAVNYFQQKFHHRCLKGSYFRVPNRRVGLLIKFWEINLPRTTYSSHPFYLSLNIFPPTRSMRAVFLLESFCVETHPYYCSTDRRQNLKRFTPNQNINISNWGFLIQITLQRVLCMKLLLIPIHILSGPSYRSIIPWENFTHPLLSFNQNSIDRAYSTYPYCSFRLLLPATSILIERK